MNRIGKSDVFLRTDLVHYIDLVCVRKTCFFLMYICKIWHFERKYLRERFSSSSNHIFHWGLCFTLSLLWAFTANGVINNIKTTRRLNCFQQISEKLAFNVSFSLNNVIDGRAVFVGKVRAGARGSVRCAAIVTFCCFGASWENNVLQFFNIFLKFKLANFKKVWQWETDFQ